MCANQTLNIFLYLFNFQEFGLLPNTCAFDMFSFTFSGIQFSFENFHVSFILFVEAFHYGKQLAFNEMKMESSNRKVCLLNDFKSSSITMKNQSQMVENTSKAF